jgi:hypothetical protein
MMVQERHSTTFMAPFNQEMMENCLEKCKREKKEKICVAIFV